MYLYPPPLLPLLLVPTGFLLLLPPNAIQVQAVTIKNVLHLRAKAPEGNELGHLDRSNTNEIESTLSRLSNHEIIQEYEKKDCQSLLLEKVQFSCGVENDARDERGMEFAKRQGIEEGEKINS